MIRELDRHERREWYFRELYRRKGSESSVM